jgi:hypothetical protein
VSVRVKDVQAAIDEAKRLVADADGTVFAEQTDQPEDGGDSGTLSSRLTFKVPPQEFDGVVTRLSKLGTSASRTTSTEDVTSLVVDVEARIRSQRESVNRVRALLAQAKTLGEVVQVEAELTRRVADLEALESKQKALTDQVGASTVNLTLSGPYVPPAEPDEDENSFLAGLEDGWSAFTATVGVTLAVLGAVLPFLVLLAVLWLPGRWVVRQVRTRMPAPTTAGAYGAPPAPPPGPVSRP